jgi:DNA invertase Pin-like site-specific DNA recombinase
VITVARKSRKHQAEELLYAEALYIYTALYIRLSVEDRDKRGNSIETQQMVLENHLFGKPEFEVRDIYIDNGCTGTNFQRPAFQRMLADIEDGKINCVIVKDLSRLGRSSIDTGYYIEQYFPAHKVRFISVGDCYDSENPDNLHGGVILPLKNMINEAYSMDIGRKVKAQLRQAMQDGEYVGGRAPYGYRTDPNDCHKLLVDEEAGTVVRQIFEWAYAKVGLNDIVMRLNAAGVQAPSHYKHRKGEITHENLVGSGVWQTRTVAKILNAELYTGDMVQGATKVVDHRQVRAGTDNLIAVPGTHEAIISKEIFEAVRAWRMQVAEESRRREVTPYTLNIFKGKMFCAHCGGSLHRQRSTRKTMPDVYLHYCLANSRIKKGACAGVLMYERDLFPEVRSILKARLAGTLKRYAARLRSEAEWERWLDGMQFGLAQIKAQLLRDRKFNHSLYDNLDRGIVNETEYRVLKERRDADIFSALAEKARLEKGIAALTGQIARYEALRQAMKDLNSSHHLPACLVEFLVERLDITHDREITLTARFEDEWEQHSEVWWQCVSI